DGRGARHVGGAKRQRVGRILLHPPGRQPAAVDGGRHALVPEPGRGGRQARHHPPVPLPGGLSTAMAGALGDLEEAIAALGRGDPDSARLAVARAVEADASLFAVADAVALACAELEAEDEVSPQAWNVLADVCPPELLPAVEFWRR